MMERVKTGGRVSNNWKGRPLVVSLEMGAGALGESDTPGAGSSLEDSWCDLGILNSKYQFPAIYILTCNPSSELTFASAASVTSIWCPVGTVRPYIQ